MKPVLLRVIDESRLIFQPTVGRHYLLNIPQAIELHARAQTLDLLELKNRAAKSYTDFTGSPAPQIGRAHV